MKMHKLRLVFLFSILSGICFTSCFDIKDKRTTISVVDADRHYPPILFGQKLEVIYKIENVGEEPLFINEIHVSGGCELLNKNELKVLPVGSKGFIHVNYDGTKNIGYVKNYVTIYANFKSGNKEEFTFDLNVVPNSLSVKDYEEVFKEKDGSFSTVKEHVDGSENERRYKTD